MPHVIHHTDRGVFIGTALGMAYFSEEETAGQYTAVTFETPKQADEAITFLGVTGLSMTEVDSGHWRDLRSAGLPVGDMETNQLMFATVAGSA